MKLLIVSDTHGRIDRLDQVIAQVGGHDLLLHAGDLAEDVLGRYSNLLTVCGNNDRPCITDLEKEFDVLGVHGLLLHGHQQNIKKSPLPLIYFAAERQARLIVFGHTHRPALLAEDGRVFLNPGSLSYNRDYTECTYATAELNQTEDGVMATFAFYTLGGQRIPSFDMNYCF